MIRKNYPICHFCKHFNTDAFEQRRLQTCRAFPKELPDIIFENHYDHRNPFLDDNGIQFEKYEDVQKLPVYLQKGSKEQIEELYEITRASMIRYLMATETHEDKPIAQYLKQILKFFGKLFRKEK